MNKSSLFVWYPKIADLGTVPMPDTVMVPIPLNEILTLVDDDSGKRNAFWKTYQPIIDEVVTKLGVPLFVRTDFFSSKHEWKETCYIPTPDTIKRHITRLIESSFCVNGVGLPINGLAFRKFLTLDTRFTFFNGDLPIGFERRYFVRNGAVVCHHPYWAPGAFLDYNRIAHKYSADQMQCILATLTVVNQETENEIKLLTNYSQAIAKVFPESYYSIDYAKDITGKWFLIDMADGDQSWHDEKCVCKHV